MEILRSLFSRLGPAAPPQENELPSQKSVNKATQLQVQILQAGVIQSKTTSTSIDKHKFSPPAKANLWTEFCNFLPWGKKIAYVPPTREELRAMSVEQLKQVSKNQRNGLTFDQIVCLSPEQVHEILRLVDAKKLSMPPNKLSLLRGMNLGAEGDGDTQGVLLHVYNFDNLTPYQCAALVAKPNLPHLLPEELQKINVEHVRRILGEEGFKEVILSLKPEQLNALMPSIEPMPADPKLEDLNRMSPAQLNQLPQTFFEKFRYKSTQFANQLSYIQIRGLDTTRIGSLSPAQIDGLAKAGKLDYLSEEMLNGLTPEQAAKFSPAALETLDPIKRELLNKKISHFLQEMVEVEEHDGVRKVYINFDKVNAKLNLQDQPIPFPPLLVREALRLKAPALPHLQGQCAPMSMKAAFRLPEEARTLAPGKEIALVQEESYTAAFSSTYPTLTRDGRLQRHGDPIVDDAVYMIGKTHGGTRRFIHSATDGSGHVGKNDMPLKAAKSANEGFVALAADRLAYPQTDQELTEIPFDATLAARDKIQAQHAEDLKSIVDKSDPPLPGETVHVGIVIIEYVPGAFIAKGSAVGDMSAYLVKKDGRIIELTRPTDVRQPPQIGGERGLVMSNYNEFSFEAETGDSYIVMSDGVRDNLKPSMLYLSPREVIQELKNAKFPITEIHRQDLADIEDMDYPGIWRDPKNFKSQLERLEDLYAAYLLTVKLPEEAKRKGVPLPQAAVEFAREQNAARIEYGAAGLAPGIKHVPDGNGTKPVIIKGKPDHTSFSQITL